MTRLPAILLGMSIFASGLIMGWPTSSAAIGPETAGSPPVGKYQAVAGPDGRLFLIDSSTGNCWMTATDEPADWVNLESPFAKPVKQQFVKPVE